MTDRQRSIWVAGYPSFCGGADTELDHNIDLWRARGVEVNLVPMPGYDPAMKDLCDRRGCLTHAYRPDVFAGRTVVSFCNGAFLARLPEIVERGRPRRVVWFNCMTRTFEAERAAHAQGWIDLFGFVSGYQRGLLRPALEALGPVRELPGYRPYFSPANAVHGGRFAYRPPDAHFAVGRVSRDDQAKFSDDMWRIFDRVCTPRPKKVFVLGFGPNARRRCGPPPAAGMDWQTWAPGAVRVSEIYGRLHCLVHKTGGSRESYCRVVPEAYAHGVPVVVEDDYAFPELVEDGVTGFRCRSSDEMSFRASELAFDEPRRRRMILAARAFLTGEVADAERCWWAWRDLLDD